MLISVDQQRRLGNGVVSNKTIDCDAYLNAIYTAKYSPNFCDKQSVLVLCCNACQRKKFKLFFFHLIIRRMRKWWLKGIYHNI